MIFECNKEKLKFINETPEKNTKYGPLTGLKQNNRILTLLILKKEENKYIKRSLFVLKYNA